MDDKGTGVDIFEKYNIEEYNYYGAYNKVLSGRKC